MESALPALAHRRHSEPDRRLLLATSYVPPKLAEQLLELRIEFLDAAGNVYLDGPIYIFISGKKAARKTIRLNRALRPAGRRLLYVFLKGPRFPKRPTASWPPRQISRLARCLSSCRTSGSADICSVGAPDGNP